MRDEHFEIVLDATPEDIWWALTSPEGLASWLGTHAASDARVGGERVVGWGDVEIRGRFADLEPGRRIRVVYLVDGDEVGAEEWLIDGHGSVTRLTLVNSMQDDGIDDWEGFYGDIRRGWRLFLASLRHALAGAVTPTRSVQHTYIGATGDRTDLRTMLDRALESGRLTDGMERALDDPPHSLLLTAPDRTLLFDIEGSGDDQVLYAQAASHGAPLEWCVRSLERVAAGFGD